MIDIAKLGRWVGRARAEAPGLLLLPGIVLGGEGARFVTDFWVVMGVLVLLAVMLFFIPARAAILRTALLSIILGGVSEALVLLTLPEAPYSPDGRYLVQVSGRPRFREPGGISVPVRILKYQSAAPELGWIDASPNLRMYCRGVDLPWKNISSVYEGSVVVIKADIEQIPVWGNPFSYSAHLRRHGFVATCKVRYSSIPVNFQPPSIVKVQDSIKQVVRQHLGDDERGGLLLSMVFGVDDTLSIITERAFRETGLAHLLVVSGYQVTLIYVAISGFVSRLTRRALYRARIPAVEWVSALCGVSAAIGYSWLVYFDAPTMRAAIGSVLASWAGAVERGKGMGSMLIASMVILFVLSPGALFDPSAELTYAALWGIWLGLREERGLLEYLSVCFYASAATAIVSLPWFGSMSLLGFLLNPIIVPTVSVVSCAGGILGLILVMIKLDPTAILLRSSGDLLMLFRDTLLFLSQNIDGVVKADTVAGVTIGVVLLLIIARRGVWKLRGGVG